MTTYTTNYKNKNEDENENENENENGKTIPLKDEEQVGVVGSNSIEWPTIAETKTLRLRRATKFKIEESQRTTPSFKRKGASLYKRKGMQSSTFASMTPKVMVKRVENYEGLVNIVRYKEDGKIAALPPGTHGDAKTVLVPTGAGLPGTCNAAETTPISTGDKSLGTNGAVGTAPFPTGTAAEEEREEGKIFPSTSYALPPTPSGEDTTENRPEEKEDDVKTVVMSTDEEEEAEVPEKRKRSRGRPPTTGKGVGLRKKREEEAKAREERKSEAKIRWVLDPIIPAGKRWEKFRDREEELRQELTMAPTQDLQTRVLEDTARIFKAADCSSKMKGELVHILKEAASTMRAMLLILADRVKERERTTGPSERERYLEQQVKELKRRIEEVEKSRSTPSTETPTPGPRRKLARRRTVIKRDDEDASAPSVSHTASPPLPQAEIEPQGVRGDERASHSSSGYCNGPALKGITRQVEAYPQGVKPQDREQFDALAKQRAKLAIRRNKASVDPTRIKEYVALEVQLQHIAAQMDALRMSDGMDRSHPKPCTAPSYREEGTKAPSSQVIEKMQGVENTLSFVPETQKKKKKKKKKKKGNSPPADVGTQPAKGEKSGQKPARARTQQGPNRGSQKPITGGERKPPAHDTRDTASPPDKEKETWSQVVGRRARCKGRTGEGNAQCAPPPTVKPRESGKGRAQNQTQSPPSSSRSPPSSPLSSPSQEGKRRKGRKKPPRTAAVVITCPPGEYRETLREAVEKIDLASLNIGGMTARKAVTGAHIYEIGGLDKEQKADALAAKLRELTGQKEGVRVSRPTMMAEIRIRGLDESVVPADIRRAVANCGGCSPDDVKSGEVQMGARGPGTVWVRCPIAAANKVVAAKTILVGWIKARVEALERRPLQCFKCMKKGHTIAQCSGPDRSNLCYRCGKPGHAARECRAPEHCPVCADLGRPAAHRAGSKPCASPKAGKVRKKGQKPPALPPAQNLSQEGRNKGPEKKRAPPPSTAKSGEVETPKPQRPKRERGNPPSQQPPKEGTNDRMDID